MGVHSPIPPRHRRIAIEGEIEMHLQWVTLLLARLDRADGDCDLEEGSDREAVNEDDGPELYKLLPRYDLDQSRGPVNERAAGGSAIAR